MKDFNIAKYLKENHLGSHAILGNYVDLHALKEAEDLEGLEIVKGFGATKSKSVADQFAKTAITAGMEGVKVVEKNGVFKIYAKAGQKLNKEEEEMELDTKIPYEGPEHKVDGFGDKFKQTNAVEEADSMIDRDWEDATLDMLSREYRSWLDQNNLPQMSADELLNDPNIEKTDGQIKYLSDFITRWEDAQDDEEIYGGAVEEGMNDDDSENPFPSIINGEEDMDPDTRFADLGGDQIKTAIKSLMDDGFDSREIAQFVVDTIRGFKSFKK